MAAEVIFQSEKDKEKISKAQKFSCYVAVYRFLFQLLIGIADMRKMKDLIQEYSSVFTLIVTKSIMKIQNIVEWTRTNLNSAFII